MNKKKIMLLAVAVVILLSGFIANSIFTEKELSSFELEFLNCFGDVSSDVEGENPLSIDLVVRTDLYNIKKIVAKLNESEEVKFDNEKVKIQDFVFVEGNLKYGTLKEIMLNITYSTEGEVGTPLEVNKIFVEGKQYDIGSVSFVPAEFKSDEALGLVKVPGKSLGGGLDKYGLGIENNSKEKLDIDAVELGRFHGHIKEITLNRGNDKTVLKAPSYSFSLAQQEKNAEIVVEFDATPLEEYEVFYFSPSILYHTEDGAPHKLNLYTYTSGLLLTDEDMRSTGIQK